MKKIIYLATVFVFFSTLKPLPADIRNTGVGLAYTSSAQVIPKGTFALTNFSRFFFKDRTITQPSDVQTGVTIWDIHNGLALSYGLSHKFELGFSQIIYQDTNTSGRGYDFPGDIVIYGKFGGLRIPNSGLCLAFLGLMRLPIGEKYNIPFEPYSSGRIELGCKGVISYFSDTGTNIHLNIDFISHNDLQKPMSAHPVDPGSMTTTRQMLYGLGFARHSGEFETALELHGNIFLIKPVVNAYSRESAIFLTPSVQFSPNVWLGLRVGADFRLNSDKDETNYKFGISKPGNDMPNYPSWRLYCSLRVQGGHKIVSLTQKKIDSIGSDITVIDEIQHRDKEIYEKLSQERKKTENAEEELERIRKERERMEKMLEQLRNSLDWNKKPGSKSDQDSNKNAQPPK